MTPSAGSGVVHPENCLSVTSGAGSGRWGHASACRHVASVQGLGWCHPRASGHPTLSTELGEAHRGDYGHVTPGADTLKQSTWSLWMCEPRARVWEVWSPLRQDVRPQVQGLEEGSPWQLWICDPRFRVLEDIHPAECGHVILHTGSAKVFTRETVAM